MASITITIPEDLKDEIKKHHEVNWNAITQKAMQDHLRKLHIAEAISGGSRLTQKDILELDRLVKKGIAKAHGIGLI